MVTVTLALCLLILASGMAAYVGIIIALSVVTGCCFLLAIFNSNGKPKDELMEDRLNEDVKIIHVKGAKVRPQ